jgi:hypothetical protein
MRWAGHVARVEKRRGYTGFWWGNLKEKDHLGDPGVDGCRILRLLFRKWDVGVANWIELAQDGDRLRAFVTAVMNLRVP